MRYIKYILSVAIFLVSVIAVNGQQKRYVTTTGNGIKSGMNWENASDNIQVVIDASVAGDSILIAEGNYKVQLILKEGVSLYGGFNGSEKWASQRLFPGAGKQLVVLDGDFTNRVILQVADFSEPTIVDGFVIENGSALSGAGVSIRKGTTLRRCIVRNNIAGTISEGDYMPNQGGIVYRIDRSTGKGYVMALENHGTNYSSGKGTLMARSILKEAKADVETIGNNKKMNNSRAAQAVGEYRAALPADKYNDWLIPAAGDWALLINGSEKPGERTELGQLIEKKLVELGRPNWGKDKYWSSTAANNDKYAAMWYANMGTSSLNVISAHQYMRIRPVRAFDLSIGSGNGGGVFAGDGARIEGCLITENQATEGSGIFTEGVVQIHYSSIMGNKQNGFSETNKDALVMKTATSVSDYPSLVNCVIWGNTDFGGDAANFTPPQLLKMYYTAFENPNGVTGMGNILLSNDDTSPAYPHFASVLGGDYRPLKTSLLFNAGDARRLPSGLNSDLAGVARIKSTPSTLGAFEAIDNSGVATPSVQASIFVYPALVAADAPITIRHRNGKLLHSVVICSLDGTEIVRKEISSTETQVSISVIGSYILRVLDSEGGMTVTRIVVGI